jgi:hypothetical protein
MEPLDMSADIRSRFRSAVKVCGVAAVALLAFIALCPGAWVPRTNFGFELDHFLAFFLTTLMVCLAWPRPLLAGGALVIVGTLLEALQGLTPDRNPTLLGAFYSVVGVLSAALIAQLVIQGRQRWADR